MSLSPERYILTFEERPEYLYARVTAAMIDRDSALEYLTEVSQQCRQLKRDKLILERDIPAMLPDADLFFTTNDFLNMIRGVKVAFVNPHTTISDEMKFAILIGTNRGGNFTLHNSVASAERWLLG